MKLNALKTQKVDAKALKNLPSFKAVELWSPKFDDPKKGFTRRAEKKNLIPEGEYVVEWKTEERAFLCKGKDIVAELK